MQPLLYAGIPGEVVLQLICYSDGESRAFGEGPHVPPASGTKLSELQRMAGGPNGKLVLTDPFHGIQHQVPLSRYLKKDPEKTYLAWRFSFLPPRPIGIRELDLLEKYANLGVTAAGDLRLSRDNAISFLEDCQRMELTVIAMKFYNMERGSKQPISVFDYSRFQNDPNGSELSIDNARSAIAAGLCDGATDCSFTLFDGASRKNAQEAFGNKPASELVAIFNRLGAEEWANVLNELPPNIREQVLASLSGGDLIA